SMSTLNSVNQVVVARCVYYVFLSESQVVIFNFIFLFSPLTVIGVIFQTSPPKRFAVSVDAHYRESENSRNSFFAFFSSTAAIHSKTPTYTFLSTNLSTDRKIFKI
ncbi:MAG: hypothetical protein ACTH5W_19425, partial [Providencia sp.]|uniref:hypothetical protein n=1 Tax=Providencia sp. TaxID=589 RepID=UPI003F98E7A7